MQYEDVLSSLAEECEIYVALDEIIAAVREELELTNPLRVRQTVLALVRDLLVEHRAVACLPNPDWANFEAWQLPSKCALDRIDHEWAALGRDPAHCEVVCFVLPDALPG